MLQPVEAAEEGRRQRAADLAGVQLQAQQVAQRFEPAGQPGGRKTTLRNVGGCTHSLGNGKPQVDARVAAAQYIPAGGTAQASRSRISGGLHLASSLARTTRPWPCPASANGDRMSSSCEERAARGTSGFGVSRPGGACREGR